METPALLAVAFLMFCWIFAPVQSHVQTLNQLPASIKNSSGFETTGFNETVVTASLCTEGNVTKDQQERLRSFLEYGKVMGYIRFYVLAQNIAPLHEPQMGKLTEFESLLKLPASFGWHDVTVVSNNHSNSELESALEYAWQIQFDAYATEHKIRRDTMIIRIFWHLNEGDTLTTFGSPISRIVYIVTISDLDEMEKLSQIPPTDGSERVIKRIPHPSETDFAIRLKEKGVEVYDKELFYASYMIFKGHPQSLNVSQLRNELLTELESSRDAMQPPCETAGKLDVLIGTPIHHVLISNSTNGSYSQGDLTLLYYQPTTNGKVNTYWRSQLEPKHSQLERIPHPEIYQRYKTNRSFNYYLQPGFSFRMYTSAPVNFQSLPQIEADIAEQLSKKLVREDQLVNVIIWNPDLNNSVVVNFFVVLEVDGVTSFPLNPSLFYAEQIYAHLEGLQTKVDCYQDADLYARKYVTLSRQPIPLAARYLSGDFLKDCQDGRISYRASGEIYDCPLQALQENFTIYLLAGQTELPSNARIEEIVKAAFAEVNPLTIDNARFSVTLSKHQPIFRTTVGSSFNVPLTHRMHADRDGPEKNTLSGHAVRFDFSLSFTNVPSSRMHNLWKIPLQLIADKLTADNPDVMIFHPDASFRLYTNPPISMQSLLTIPDMIHQLAVFDGPLNLRSEARKYLTRDWRQKVTVRTFTPVPIIVPRAKRNMMSISAERP
ncbi:uncharacterized protein LOC129589997 isoform X2 [Paramacrobiotus metropolitanus]|uniref:uncharacterized protein LOC129589997 isoform X2 n=1 Tax=Paramacrobiotus metropolitanus TaxID=2943436 RepID=UPI0024459AB9|nr:uncharacterized protein LOC129589997 isoform X2 [Paramacrobiotus metropolitanus]